MPSNQSYRDEEPPVWKTRHVRVIGWYTAIKPGNREGVVVVMVVAPVQGGAWRSRRDARSGGGQSAVRGDPVTIQGPGDRGNKFDPVLSNEGGPTVSRMRVALA